MSALPQIESAEATGEAAALLTQMRKSIGSIPNMAKAMANIPALLKGYMGLSSALAGGVLPAGVRERLALATAEYNGCTYCLSVHTFLARNAAKLDGGEIERARGRGTIDDTTIKTARAAGVTNAEIAEVIGNLALNILTNYFNIVADTDNESPRHAARAPLTSRRRGQPVIT
jgi:AhpD family alkylhydroperoxidase